MHLTIENLARAIHEDQQKASNKIVPDAYRMGSYHGVFTPFDELTVIGKSIRREQARLMLERIMR